MFVGDLNYNLKNPKMAQVLKELCDIFDFTIKLETCSMRDNTPFIVLIPYMPQFLLNPFLIDCRVSDSYNISS